jgi:hypothetical protein
MLKLVQSDLIRLVLSVESKWFSVLVDQLEFMRGEYGYPLKMYKRPSSKIWIMKIELGQESLTLALYYVYHHKCLEFRFKGEIRFDLFEQRLILLQEYSLRRALLWGRVKRLELALDIFGVKSKDYIFHVGGAKTGFVCMNADDTGRTYYLGSRESSKQFACYDKSQECKDKGKPHTSMDMLRIELRILRRSVCLLDLIKDLVESDPFDSLYVAPKAAMLNESKKVKNWKLLIEMCSTSGVPNALKAFPPSSTPNGRFGCFPTADSIGINNLAALR